MLSRLLVVLHLVLFVVAQSSTSQSIVCAVGQCLQGYASISLGETLSAQGDTAVHLLPGQYTSTTTPELLHTLLTSSSATLSSSPGFNLTSVNPLPLNIALLPGIAIYSNPLFGGQAAFSELPTSPINASIPLPASSVALANNVWIALTSGSSPNPIIFWKTIPDVSQLPPEASVPLALVNLQSSACSPPCSGNGVCSASATCSCPAGFTGSSCEQCAPGFFGPNCKPCPSECESCDQGISGSGRCFVPLIGNAPATCNCVNGQCDTNGTCACLPGWADAANGTACAQCAPGFFLSTTGECQVCQIGCSQCTDGTAACTACSSGFSQNENDATSCNPLPSTTSSGITCPDGSYSAGQQCAACSPSCQTCNGPSSNNCIVCAAKTSLFQGTCVATDPNSGVCEGTNGMVVNNVKQKCDTCGAKCTSCEIPNYTVASTASQIQCTGCLPGSFLSQGQCVANCTSGNFVSPQDNLTCMACSSMCSSCLGSANYCLTCANGQLAFSGQCVSSCPSGTFSSSGACIPCHPDCASCTGSSFNQCSACPPKLPVLTAGRCLPTCGQSEFFDLTSSTCQTCDSSCSSCSNAGPTHCLACSGSNEVLVAGSCVTANCTGSSSVIPELGVCLSDLVKLPPTSSTTTSGSGLSSMPVPTSSSGATGSKGSTAIKSHKMPWWQILLITLGCLFIVILLLLLWRRWVRKRREEDTVMFASAKHLDGGDGWRWRLKQFKRLLFGGKKGGYDVDDPPMPDYRDTVSHPRLSTANIDIGSPPASPYLDSPQPPPRSKYRPPPKRLNLNNRPSSMIKRPSSNPPSSRKSGLGDSPGWYSDSPPREWPSDDFSPQKGRIAPSWLSEDPYLPKTHRPDNHSSTSRYPTKRICLDDPLDNSLSRYPQAQLNSDSRAPSRASEVRLNYLSPPPSYRTPQSDSGAI